MDIKYLGHSSFKMSFKNVSLITDPYDSYVGFDFAPEKADIVTVSHDHKDHNNYSAVKDYKKLVFGPGEYEIEGISIVGISSFHDDQKGKLRGKNTIYVYEAEDLRIAHLGDLGHKLDESSLEKIGDIDLLFVPVGGVYTIDSKTAASVIQSIEPEIVIPMHYKTPEHNKEVFGELSGYDEFVKHIDTKPVIDKKFTIKSKDLTDEEQKLVILEKI